MDPRLTPVADAVERAQADVAAQLELVQSALDVRLANVLDLLTQVQSAARFMAGISLVPVSLAPISAELAAVAFPPAVLFRTIAAPTEGSGEFANDAVQEAIYAAGTGTPLYLPAGRYLWDAARPVRLRSFLSLYLDPDAVIVVANNALPRYQVFIGEGVEDVLIEGGQLVGDRVGHDYGPVDGKPSTHEWGMGIQIKRGRRVTLRRIKTRNFTGDGFSISGDDLHVVDCVALYNARQGLSIYACRTVRVIRGEYAFTGQPVPGDALAHVGTKPMCGIDVEPDQGDAIDVLIDGAWVHDNRSSGILSWSRTGTGADLDVRIVNCSLQRNTNPVEAAGYGGVARVYVRACRMTQHTGAFGALAMSGAIIVFGGSTEADANTVDARTPRPRTTTPGKYDLLLRTGGGLTAPGVINAGLNYYQ